jgi:putative PIN family toxin of toxin-antitoxin system
MSESISRQTSIYGTISSTMYRFILDTNVLVSALISRNGASFQLLSLVGTDSFEVALSPALVLEYEAVLKENSGRRILLSHAQIDDILDYLCAVSIHVTPHFLWRPFLTDLNDDMLLEAAIAANCTHLVTHNLRHFKTISVFGIEAIPPASALTLLRNNP